MSELSVMQCGCEKQFYLSQSCRNAALTNNFLWAAGDATSSWETVLSEAAVTHRSCEKQFLSQKAMAQCSHEAQFDLRRPWRDAAVRNNFIWAGRGAMKPWNTVLSEVAVTMSDKHRPTCPAVVTQTTPPPCCLEAGGHRAVNCQPGYQRRSCVKPTVISEPCHH